MRRLLPILLIFITSAAYGAELFSDDFEGGDCNAPEWDAACPAPDTDNYTPNTAETVWTASPTDVNDEVLNCYELAGTNEQSPCTLGVTFASPKTDLFIQWEDYYEASMPFGTSSKKLLRCGKDDAPKIEIGMLATGANTAVQIVFFWNDAETEASANSGEGVPTGEWVTWALHVHLNTVGLADGFMVLYKNGTPYLTIADNELRGGAQEIAYCWIGGNNSMLTGTLPTSGSRYINDVEFHDSDPGPTPTPTATPIATVPTPAALGNKCKCKGKGKERR